MSNFDPSTAEYYGEFVEYAYKMYDSDPNNLTPPPPQSFPSSEFQIISYINAVDTFLGESETKFYGYAAVSTSPPAQLIIAIRGTQALIEWLIDAEVWPTPFTTIPAGGYVEYGFFSVFQTLSFVTPAGSAMDKSTLIKSFVQTNTDPSITIVGHSLGGALTTMFALDLLYNDPSLNPYTTVYTLASPSLGDSTFADLFNSTVKARFRVWNEYDLVPVILNWIYTQVDGDGNELVQTEQQLEQIKPTVECEHELLTYLWLLNPNNQFGLNPTCQASNTAATEGIKAVLGGRKRAR